MRKFDRYQIADDENDFFSLRKITIVITIYIYFMFSGQLNRYILHRRFLNVKSLLEERLKKLQSS